MSNLSEKWEISNLGKYGSCIRGVSYKPKDIREEYSDDTVCILRSNNIKDNRINYNEVVYVDKKLVSDNQKLKENDIAICMSNGSKQLVGKNGIYSKNKMLTSIGAFCALFRSNEFVEPRFTKMLFESYSYKKFY